MENTSNNVEDLFGDETSNATQAPASNAIDDFWKKKDTESKYFPKEPGTYKCKLLSIALVEGKFGPLPRYTFKMQDGSTKTLDSGSAKLRELKDMVGATVIVKVGISNDGKTTYSL